MKWPWWVGGESVGGKTRFGPRSGVGSVFVFPFVPGLILQSTLWHWFVHTVLAAVLEWRGDFILYYATPQLCKAASVLTAKPSH